MPRKVKELTSDCFAYSKLLMQSSVSVIGSIMKAWGCFRRETWKQFVSWLCDCICPSHRTFCREEEHLTALIVCLSWKKNYFPWFCGGRTLELSANSLRCGEGPFGILQKLSDHFLSTLWEIMVVSFQNTY